MGVERVFPPPALTLSRSHVHFLVNVGSRAEAKAFADGDPFREAGLFTGVTITRMRRGQWNPQAAEGA
jgi:uncharacterized protein YciI